MTALHVKGCTSFYQVPVLEYPKMKTPDIPCTPARPHLRTWATWRQELTLQHGLWALLVGQFFALGYLGIPRIVEGREWINLSFRFEDHISYQSWAALPYTLGYIYAVSPAWWFPEIRLFRRGALSLMATMAISFLCFLFIPVKVITPQPSGFWDALLLPRLIWLNDGGWNAFPSLHVATATLAWGSLKRLGPTISALATIAWALIFASTLLIKKHYLLDAIAGTVLGLAMHRLIVEPAHRAREEG